MTRIFVDADACPVKEETIRVGERHKLHVIFVANGGLRPSRDPLVTNHIVPQGADAADDWIVDNAVAGDIVITSDVPLAKRCVDKQAYVLGPTGREFSPDSIGMAVAMRDLKQELRETGAIAGHNPSFSKRDRSEYLQALERAVQKSKH